MAEAFSGEHTFGDASVDVDFFFGDGFLKSASGVFEADAAELFVHGVGGEKANGADFLFAGFFNDFFEKLFLLVVVVGGVVDFYFGDFYFCGAEAFEFGDDMVIAIFHLL